MGGRCRFYGVCVGQQLNTDQLVMVVDDNPLIQGVIRSVLQSENIHVITCSDGQEALESLKTNHVDLIICDVMMPIMGGFELYQKVREETALFHVPFLFLTALDGEEDKLKGLESGADDYICKPFDPKELVSIVRGKLHRSKAIKTQSDSKYESYRRKVLHTLSHEFRTPLVAINTSSELLLERPELEKTKIKILVEAIQRGGLRLERLVNDFMLLQQIEAGLAERLYSTRSEPILVSELCERITSHVKSLVDAEGGAISIETSLNAQKVNVYEPQVLDAVRRIVHNAIKFSKADKTVEIEYISVADEFLIRVKDRGIGISESQREDLLKPFAQIDRETLEQQGSGVGLAIAGAYLRIQGGHLTIESREGGGTIVTIILSVN